MSLKQYTFQILPKKAVFHLEKLFEKRFLRNVFDEAPFWLLNPIKRDVFFIVSGCLIREQSWSKQIDLYGSQEGNAMEVYFDSATNIVISASLRLDFTSNYKSKLSFIIDFCFLNGFILLDEDLDLIHMNVESVSAVIENSIQKKRFGEFGSD